MRADTPIGIATIAGIALAGVALRFAFYAWLARAHGGLDQALCRWDCLWYSDLIAGGYDHAPRMTRPPRFDEANWAFFPLFPMAGATVARLARVSALHAGIMVSLLSTVGS